MTDASLLGMPYGNEGPIQEILDKNIFKPK